MTWLLPKAIPSGIGEIRTVSSLPLRNNILGVGESGKRGFPAQRSKPRSGESQKHCALADLGFTPSYENDVEGVKERRAALRRAYDRAYYHAKRKGKVKPAWTAKRKAQRAALYYANIERERANARARYWRNRDKYAAAARERKRRKAQG